MTEADWLACTKPWHMFMYLRRSASDRKVRLFGCACCRSIWDLLPDESHRDLVVWIEDFPNGTFDDLLAAAIHSSRGEHEFVHDDGFWAVKYLGRSYYKLPPWNSAQIVAFKVAKKLGKKMEDAIQPALLHDIFGNPFHPITLDPSWLTPKAKALALTIYDNRTFDRLPSLADALEEAGCFSQEVLAHCREPGPHVRGCWVVDAVLGKV